MSRARSASRAFAREDSWLKCKPGSEMQLTREVYVRARFAMLLGSFAFVAPLAAQQAPGGQLIVFNAGSLARPFSELLKAFKAKYPDVVLAQENSGSLEAARKLTDLGKTPDVLGVADYGVIPKLLIPAHTNWYATFARNAMVLIHTDQSVGAREINGRNWWQVLLRPGGRSGHSDPALDPNGYRTLMV